jgi:hypothetical protein
MRVFWLDYHIMNRLSSQFRSLDPPDAAILLQKQWIGKNLHILPPQTRHVGITAPVCYKNLSKTPKMLFILCIQLIAIFTHHKLVQYLVECSIKSRIHCWIKSAVISRRNIVLEEAHSFLNWPNPFYHQQAWEGSIHISATQGKERLRERQRRWFDFWIGKEGGPIDDS